MRKNYLILTLLLASSSLTSMAAMTEEDFNSSKQDAIAKVTSWSNASPFAPEAFEKGLADLSSLQFSNFASGDAAVEGVEKLLSSTLKEARTEFDIKLPTIFVTMTTDALTANPVDGKSLFGTMNTTELLDLDAMKFQTYDKACQASAWHLYPTAKNAGFYGMRNNMTYYLRMFENEEGTTQFCPFYSYSYQPNFKIDFAENGKMQLRLEDGRYMGTDAEGAMTVYDEFCDATSWTFTRAYGPQCDMPMLSTKSDPEYYMIRSVFDPDLYLTSVYPSSVYMEMGKPSSRALWYFTTQTVCNNDWMWCNNKVNGVLNRPDNSDHAHCGPIASNSKPYMTFLVVDGLEDKGLLLFLDYQTRYQMVETFSSPSTHILCYDPAISPGVQVDISYFRPGRDLMRFLWTVESGADADLMSFIDARENAVASLRRYVNSQPWAHETIEETISKIENSAYTDYADIDAALADIDSKVADVINALPTLMVAEASKPNIYFTLNNVRREESKSESGWIVTTIDGKFANTISANTDGAAWMVEPINETSFYLKNLEGYYVGTMKSGQNVEITQDASSAAKLSFKLSDGNIVISASRSALNLDENDGTLMANSASDPGSQWTLGKKIIIKDDWLQYSTFDYPISYEISALTNSSSYLEGSPNGWYVVTRDYFNEECYWYFEKAEDGNGSYIICTPYGKTRSRIWWWRGDGSPCMWDDTADQRSSYDDRWYIIPVDHESNSDEQRAYQISLNYPPEGNSCISNQKNQVGCLLMKPATDLESTVWIFKKLGGLDHERIFNEQLIIKRPAIEGAIAAQPWARSVLDPAYEHLNTCTMQDFGSDCYSAINALSAYIQEVIEEVEWLLEDEPDGCAVKIKNVRRATSGAPAYLASVNGLLNTLDDSSENNGASIWTFEYYNNGRYRLKNNNGEYMGELEGDNIGVTTDRSKAGLYALQLNDNTMSLVVRNEPSKGLNLDNDGGNACVYNSTDAGSLWVIELADPSGVNAIDANDARRTHLYDLRGLPVSPENAASGVYIERHGNKVTKRVIK